MLSTLSPKERDVVLACVRAIASADWIGEAELATRVGVGRSTLMRMVMSWPDLDDSSDASEACLAINNSLNEICHGVNVPALEWVEWFEVDRSEVERVYRKWAIGRGWKSSGVR